MKKILLFFLLITLSLTLVSCFKDADSADGAGNNTNSTAADTVKEAESVTEAKTEIKEEFYKAEGEFIDIVTPYATLKYPVSWEGSVVTDVINAEVGCTVKFSAYLDYRNIPLFDFVIGDSDSGVLLGDLKTSDGKMSVWLIDHTENADAELSEGSREMYRQMSAEVNVIISNLIYGSGMTTDKGN